jgi:hypothetical protein
MRSSTRILSRTRRNRWRAQCAKRRPLGSEGGCAEKARVQDSRTQGPRRAAHPVHESVTTTQIYLQADMALKQQALDRTTPPAAQPGRYQPPDQLLAFLEAL